LRASQCVTQAELALSQANLLLEEERGWTDFIVCRMPNCGRTLQKLPSHLIAVHREELSISDGATPKMLVEEYRRRIGYNKRAPLCSQELREVLSKITKTKNAQRRHKGKRVSPYKFRKGRAPIEAAMKAREAWGISRQQQQRMSLVRKNRGRPALQKQSATGTPISDWQIAKPRLDGRRNSDIAGKLGRALAPISIRGRLHRIGFPPGHPCLFFRGEPVTEKLLHAHFEDLKVLRTSRRLIFRVLAQGAGQQDSTLSIAGATAFLGVTKSSIHQHTRSRSKDQIPHARAAGGALVFDLHELQQWALARRNGKNRFLTTFEVEKELARRLGVGRHRVYEFLFLPGGPRSPRNNKCRKAGHPLSLDLARKLLASIMSLSEEFRRSGSTGRGGRPKSLLPSEEKDLPRKYHALKADLELMLTWAETEADVITPEILGEWMCQQWRLGKLQVLLFWPSLHPRLLEICERVRNRNRFHGGSLGFAERAKELLCREYSISRAQLVKAISEGRSPVAAA